MTGPKTPEEALAHIQEAAREGNVSWAETDECEKLAEEVERVCEAVRVAGDRKRRPIVTDRSYMSDFIGLGGMTDADGEAFLKRTSEILGIDVHKHDRVVEVADRLRKTNCNESR